MFECWTHEEYGSIIDEGAPDYQLATLFGTKTGIDVRLGRIRQKKQGVPENASHGDPLEDSRCRTKLSGIQPPSETRSKPPPDPPLSWFSPPQVVDKAVSLLVGNPQRPARRLYRFLKTRRSLFSYPVSYSCDSLDSVSRYLLPMCPSPSFPASPALYQSSFVLFITFRIFPLDHPIHYIPRTIGLHRSHDVFSFPNSSDLRT